MEQAIWIVAIGAAILLVIAGVKAWERRQERKARDAEQAKSTAKVRAATSSLRGTGASSHTAYPYPVRYAQAPQPTVVQQNSSGMDPLMAGVIGYALASSMHSGNSHAAPAPSAPLESCKPEEDRSYTPSSDSGSSYSSSDSGSSYDSGSSGGGDSGGGSSGGGD